MNIEKILCPKVGKLIKTKDSVTATIFDGELDPLSLTFHYDECVKIDTENYKFISLTFENLYDMIELLEQSERHFTKKFKTK
jgi:hypothetical protein